MHTKHFIIATAGHVDHGKSSLVKALTGTDPDRLPEEKARGITIDLGFAHLDLADPSVPGKIFRVGIVDVPGHEDFVKNMVAGVGAINLAVLVVAADDRWMPQTEEHLQILHYLGVKKAVVALTKADLAQQPEDVLLEEVRSHLANSPFSHSEIIPVSVMTGRGLNEFKQALTTELSTIEPPKDLGKPRLSVDRVFSLKGIGTVVTGTLTGGKFARGDAALVQPRGLATRVRNLQSHNADVDLAWPGTRTALNLPDLSSGTEARAIHRGDVVTTPLLREVTDAIDVLVEKSPRSAGAAKGAGRILKNGLVLKWHQGSANFSARLLLRTVNEIQPGQQALAQLRFEQPIFVLAGERFILRDWSEQFTIGGGVVLDTLNVKTNFRAASQTTFLAEFARVCSDPARSVSALLERDKITSSEKILLYSTLGGDQVASAVEQLISSKQIVRAGPFLVQAAWWQSQLAKGKETIMAYHKQHTAHQGIQITELRAALTYLPPTAGVFDVYLLALQNEGFQQVGPTISAKQHQQVLPPHLAAAGKKLKDLLLAKPLDPPSRKELVPDTAAQQALRFFLDTREAVELSPDIVMARSAYDKAIEFVVAELKARGRAGASELRQALNSSRRVVIPLLEKLDKEGITRREGDQRVLGRNAPPKA